MVDRLCGRVVVGSRRLARARVAVRCGVGHWQSEDLARTAARAAPAHALRVGWFHLAAQEQSELLADQVTTSHPKLRRCHNGMPSTNSEIWVKVLNSPPSE